MKLLALLALVMMMGSSPGFANPVATQMLNQLRASKGRPPVVYSSKLEAVARSHALDMAKHRYFAHEGRNGSAVGDRVRAQGYRWCFVAENLAKGPRDLAQVMQGWAKSKGHYKNMMHKKAAEFGLVQGPDRIWAMVLAAPC